jgi:hypothetical protein
LVKGSLSRYKTVQQAGNSRYIKLARWKVRSIDTRGANLVQGTPKHIKKFTFLEHLTVHEPRQVTDEKKRPADPITAPQLVIAVYPTLSKLRSLRLEGYQALAGYQGLTELGLVCCSIPGDNAMLSDVAQQLDKHLESLTLETSCHTSAAVVGAFVGTLAALTKLRLDNGTSRYETYGTPQEDHEAAYVAALAVLERLQDLELITAVLTPEMQLLQEIFPNLHYRHQAARRLLLLQERSGQPNSRTRQGAAKPAGCARWPSTCCPCWMCPPAP